MMHVLIVQAAPQRSVNLVGKIRHTIHNNRHNIADILCISINELKVDSDSIRRSPQRQKWLNKILFNVEGRVPSPILAPYVD